METIFVKTEPVEEEEVVNLQASQNVKVSNFFSDIHFNWIH